LTIPAREGMALKFRAELFNLVNRTDFGTPNATFVNAWFGTIRTVYALLQALKFMF
jgi:hypothetical protein